MSKNNFCRRRIVLGFFFQQLYPLIFFQAIELIKHLAEANSYKIDSATTEDTIKLYQLLRVMPYEGLDEMWKQFKGNEEYRYVSLSYCYKQNMNLWSVLSKDTKTLTLNSLAEIWGGLQSCSSVSLCHLQSPITHLLL